MSNPKYTEQKIYICNSCGVQYQTAEEAEACYLRETTCRWCEQEKEVVIKDRTFAVHGILMVHEKYALDLESNSLVVYTEHKSSKDGARGYTRETMFHLRYCPICGRKLNPNKISEVDDG
jgi:rubrerythrin